MYGIGLNSIRWRFALASVVLTVIGVMVRDKAWNLDAGQGLSVIYVGSVLGLALAIGAITFCMASKLTNLIESLRLSTEAIAEGAVDSPVDVDCACEIGGLAHSFRKMTGRLNANLVRINALAYTDPITALPNRSVIDHLLDYTLAPQRDTTFQGAIVFINLDNFKRINDTFGHEGGDELLRQAAQRMLTQGLDRSLETLDTCMDSFGNPCQRLPEDIVFARFASDEFVAIVPGLTRRDELTVLADKLLSAMQEPFRIKSQEVVIGISMGITVTPHDSRQAAELLNFADLAMNSAKRAGKSRFHFFDQSLRELILERARIEADLRRALQGNELLLHFQPKIDTETLAMVGVEALVRWQHPDRGLLMPGTFIDVAEQVGLMTQLGERVIALAVAQCRAWLDEGISRTVAVNVSPSQFIDPAFVPGVLAMLHDARVPPHLLSVEITESIAMTDIDDTAERLNALRAAGVRIAIDDFGIGFSNLSQLSRLPVDDLKIDRSLVMEIGSSPRSEVIIRAIIGMTHALGYKTIAEGIETQEQLAFLQAQGCDCVQGFLFGRPMSVQQLERWNLGRVQHTLPLRTLSA